MAYKSSIPGFWARIRPGFLGGGALGIALLLATTFSRPARGQDDGLVIPGTGKSLHVESMEGNSEAEKEFLAAVLGFYQDRPEEAITHLDRAIALDPSCTESYLLRGVCHLQMNGLEKARKDFDRYIENDASPVDGMNCVGKLLYVYHFFGEAEAYFKNALDINPYRAALHSNLGSVLVEQRRLQEARACFMKAVELDPKMAEARVNLGMLYFLLEEYSAAESAFKKAIELNDQAGVKDPLVHVNLGDLYFVLQETEASVQCYFKALEFDPSLPEVRTRLGMALQIEHEVFLAREQYELAILTGMAPPEAHANLATILLDSGEVFEAANEFKKAIGRTGFTDPNAVFSLATIYMHMDRYEDALQLFRLAFKMGVRSPSILAYLSRLAELEGYQEESLEFFRLLSSMEGENPMKRLETARRCAESRVDGIRDLERALVITRKLAEETEWKHPGVLEVMATAFAGMGDYRKAARAASQAIAALPAGNPLIAPLKTRLEDYLVRRRD